MHLGEFSLIYLWQLDQMVIRPSDNAQVNIRPTGC